MNAYWPKILPLGHCRRYLKRYGQKRPKFQFNCPHEECNGQVMHGHGCYYRMAVFKRKCHQIPIYRWCCPNCGHTLSVLPDFLTPRGHFALSVREAVLKRRARGDSWNKIVNGIAQVSRISHRTLKRWWKWYLYKAAGAAQWLSAELIQAGVNEDLLRLHTGGINPTPLDTIHWLTTLVRKYLSLLGLNPNPVMGYWGFLNTRLPANKRL